MNEKYNVTTSTYEKKYDSGYGLQYPDGHIIRIHKHILEYELHLKGGTILDFGCGTGTHLKYFLENGYIPYGCDISKTAINFCKKKMSRYEKNFHVTPNLPKLKDYFTQKFDVILSNQVLYYLNDQDIKNLISQFHEMLKMGGVFIATMMLPSNTYFKQVVSKEDDLCKVVLNGRLHETSYINFKTNEEILNLFNKFSKLHLGFYGSTIREEDGPTDHCIFIGRKE